MFYLLIRGRVCVNVHLVSICGYPFIPRFLNVTSRYSKSTLRLSNSTCSVSLRVEIVTLCV